GYAGHGSPFTPGRGTRAKHGHREGRRSGRECDRRPGRAMPEAGPGGTAGRPDSTAGRPDSTAGTPDSTAGQPDGAVAWRGHKPPGWFVLSGRALAPGEPRRAAERPGMSDTADGPKIVQAYQNHRPYLIDLAFRMLSDIGAAEDAVQDAFTRLLAA